MKKENLKGKGTMGGKALLPLVVFLVLSLATALITGSSRSVPALIFFVIAASVALMMNKERTFWEKLDTFSEGWGNSNIVTMIMIFLLAGAFSAASRESGSVQSVVNFFLSYLPTNLIVGGMFVIGCFMSLATGTSVGTIVALNPIAMGIIETTGIAPAFMVGAVISGAMFGDNLSVISDTTIVATTLTGVEMKDKFRANIAIALPAAILTFIIFTLRSRGFAAVSFGVLEYDIIKIVPYFVVLATSLMGVNVFAVLILGIFLSGGIGIFQGMYTVIEFANVVFNGFMGMAAICFIVLFVNGMVAIINYNGGIDWVLGLVKSKIKNTVQAEYAIAFLTTALSFCTAAATVAIVTAGDIVVEIGDEYNVDPRRTASLLDIFSCATIGTLVPYGAMMLAASGTSSVGPMEIIPYATYPQILLIFTLIAIKLRYPKMKPYVKKELA